MKTKVESRRYGVSDMAIVAYCTERSEYHMEESKRYLAAANAAMDRIKKK